MTCDVSTEGERGMTGKEVNEVNNIVKQRKYLVVELHSETTFCVCVCVKKEKANTFCGNIDLVTGEASNQ